MHAPRPTPGSLTGRRLTRRRALQLSAAGGALLGLEGLGFLSRLPTVSAAEATLNPSLVRFDDSIEPLVALLEETPRERLLEEVASRIGKGTSYREILTALLLAGVRNVQPRPNVGFKFHAVLVVNSAHLASQSSPDTDRWLPIFWALDYFKGAQATTQRESGWRMTRVDESKVPAKDDARGAFTRAMDAWDEPAADAAAAGIARSCDMSEAFELFARYGPRDFRDIGHKAIFVANSFRTLSAIGWQNAEPVLRSLTYALLKFEDQNPATADLAPDRPWKRNAELVANVRTAWAEGKPDDDAARQLLSTLRANSERDAAAQVVELLNNGIAPQSVWDGLLCGAGELTMRSPGIVSLHAVTTCNALRYAYEASGDDRTRLMLMTQAASFLPLFRGAPGRGRDVTVDGFEATATKATGADAVSEVFDAAGADRMAAASKALAYLSADHATAKPMIDHARRLVFLKGNDSHDYKFSSAVLEDHANVSPAWRNRYFAASLFLLPTPAERDNALVERTRAALGA
ncbi:MAG: hypothetical protein WBD40_22370 [Tepidisphaeraceae bacterium]